MEKYYVKRGNGRYEYAGYTMPDIYDGLYFHQKTENGSRATPIAYWVGSNPKEPVDINSLVNIMSMDNDLAQYIMKLQDKDSDELKTFMKENGFIKGPLQMYNWSAQDLAIMMLRFLYNKQKGSIT